MPELSPSDSGLIYITGGPLPASSDSGITIVPGGYLRPDGSDAFKRTFRREVAIKILETLNKAYVTHRGSMLKEAQSRDRTVEELLAVYLTRTIMDKVDSEYI